MARIQQISPGVRDDRRTADFWRRALGYVRRPPRYDGDEWIVLDPPAGVADIPLALDLSESPPRKYPRIHLDLEAHTGKLDEEVDRLLALGAQRVDWPHYPTDDDPEPPGVRARYVVLADPEDNVFCVAERQSAPPG
ncbi:VOC family protein [Plantactinospora sp. B24E8]|uniref:VOC family protein n=1 Tax=Plantactinospora sp. B24E8 TaxID=3153567 RepID=UPI00325CD767